MIVDAETSPVFEAAKKLIEKPLQQWIMGPANGDQRDLLQALKSCSQLPPDKTVREGMTARDTALLIFTSGTTGMPKAARITHVRGQLYMRGFAGSTGARASDRIYVTLPLYHATGGLCALGAALLNGGSVVLRKKFSAATSGATSSTRAARCSSTSASSAATWSTSRPARTRRATRSGWRSATGCGPTSGRR